MTTEPASGISAASRRGVLTATVATLSTPGRATNSRPLSPGIHPMLPGERGGALVVPRNWDSSRPGPLVVFFHGAGGDRRQGLAIVCNQAQASGALLLIPESQDGGTWDVILDEYGVDVAVLDHALKDAFARFTIDPKRIVVSGFSDGASYALSLGIANGDLFTHVMAFSPGFAAPLEAHGTPRFFISHSPADRVLPIARTSQRLVPKLQASGYDVRYLEFEGGHHVPPDVVAEAFRWLGSP